MSFFEGFVTGFAKSADTSIKKYLDSDNQLKSKLAEKRIARGELEEARHRKDNEKYKMELKGLAKKAGGTDQAQYILDKYGYDEGASVINSLYAKTIAGGKPINEIFKLSERVGQSATIDQLANFYTPPMKVGSGESMKGVGGGISKMLGGENWIQEAVLSETESVVGKLTKSSLQDVPEALSAIDDIEDYEIGYNINYKDEYTRLMGVADNFLKAGNTDKAARIKIAAESNYLAAANNERSEYSTAELNAFSKSVEKNFVTVHGITGAYDISGNFTKAKDTANMYEHALEKTAYLMNFAQKARFGANIKAVDISLALTNAVTQNRRPVVVNPDDIFGKAYIKLTDEKLFTVSSNTQSSQQSNTAKKPIVGNLISSVPSLIANIVSQASGSSARQLAILNARKTLGTDQVALNKFNTDLKSKGL
jgi:hypothetical protein